MDPHLHYVAPGALPGNSFSQPVAFAYADMGYFHQVNKTDHPHRDGRDYFITLMGGSNGQEYEYNVRQLQAMTVYTVRESLMTWEQVNSEISKLRLQ